MGAYGNSAPASSRISSFRRAATAPRSPRNKLGRSCSGTFNRTRASILSFSSIDMRSTEMASSKSVHCAICLCEARIVFEDEICACNVIHTQHLPRSSTRYDLKGGIPSLKMWMDGWISGLTPKPTSTPFEPAVHGRVSWTHLVLVPY